MTLSLDSKSNTVLTVYQAIADRIASGEYPASTWLPAERTLAARYDVDRPSVRNALVRLAREGYITQERNKRPWVNATRPYHAPPPLARTSIRPQKIAAIISQNPHYPACSAILEGINTRLRSIKPAPRVMVVDTYGSQIDHRKAAEAAALDMVLEENISTVILWHQAAKENEAAIRRCQEHGIDIVLLDRNVMDFCCDFVGVDNEMGVEQAMDYLFSLGHRKIAYASSTEHSIPVQDRERAYREYWASQSMELNPEWVFKLAYSAQPDVSQALDQWLAMEDRPTAIFALNDIVAHQLIVDLERRSLRVPDDISVVGFDDLERFSPRPALLTTIHQPFSLMGRRAIDLVYTRAAWGCENRSVKRQVYLSPSLVVRSTCRAL
jgi:DNA-binding LacI/PurR family transcriptional regulator